MGVTESTLKLITESTLKLITESTLKLITEPLNHMIDNCGKSDFKSKCGS